MEPDYSSDQDRRRSFLGRFLLRILRRQVARHDAEQTLAGILEAGGRQPLPPTPADRLVKAGEDAIRDQVARNPQAQRLAQAALQRLDGSTRARPGAVRRALAGPQQVLRLLVGGSWSADPFALPAAEQRPALPGPQEHAGHAAAVVASRYGAHLIVLAVVLLVVFAGGAPALHARVVDAHATTGAHDDLTEPEGALIPAPLPTTAATDGGLLVNPAMPLTQFPGRVQTITAQAGDTPAGLAARYHLRADTILAANGLIDPDEPITPGKPILILPFDGAYVIAGAGDTLEMIARRYQVDPQAIIDFKPNQLSPPYALQPGQGLVIPGGTAPLRDTAFVYHTRTGDTLAHIADKFDIDVQTILDANEGLDATAPLPAGRELRILPVPGVEVTVQAGDTVDSLAGTYGTDPNAIVAFAPNRLRAGATLQPGGLLILPGGQPPAPTPVPAPTAAPVAAAPPAADARGGTQPSARGAAQPPGAKSSAPAPPPQKSSPPKQSTTSGTGSSSAGASYYGTGRFIWPINGIITQYFWARHNGLDIAIGAGTPIHAADSGEVITSGWRTDGLGYAVQIDHHNGFVTVYGHMIRQPIVRVGQLVARGQVIGYIGSTGHSTGPHVHFIIRTPDPDHRYLNPLKYLP